MTVPDGIALLGLLASTLGFCHGALRSIGAATAPLPCPDQAARGFAELFFGAAVAAATLLWLLR